MGDITIIYILIANIKYLLYTNQYKQIIENINRIKNQYSNFINHSYYIYNIFVIIDELKNDNKDNNDNNEDQEECKKILFQEYNINFLKSYYEKATNDFDKLLCVLKC